MNRFRAEDGVALVTAIILTAVMLIMGAAVLSLTDEQGRQSNIDRRADQAFNLAEATLNAQAFLIGRNWPSSSSGTPAPASPAAPCSGQTSTGTLATPTATTSLPDQVQSILAQSYDAGDTPTTSQWWVTTCEEGGRDTWNGSLLNGRAYDPSITTDTTAKPRRLWVRAEARVNGRKRAVVGLVQAGQQPAFPNNLAVVTGKIDGDVNMVTNATTTAITGANSLTGPLLGSLLGSTSPIVKGPVGLRCSLLDSTDLLGCLSGLYKATNDIPLLKSTLQANDYVNFRGNSTISSEQLAQLRQQAQATNTYYGKASSGNGVVADGAACLPSGSAGKIIFIEQIGDGTGSCILNTAGGASAKSLIVGAGGVRVTGGGTYTGTIYALHRKALAFADVRISGSSKVVGGVFVDDDASLGANAHGSVQITPPTLNLTTALNSLIPGLPVCQVPILGPLTCSLTNLLNMPLNLLTSTLGIDTSTLVAALAPQMSSAMPAISYDATVVKAVTTMGDSAVVTGTFRQVTPRY